MDKQNEYYTLKQAMKRLSIMSLNTFRQLERKYPEIFVNVNPSQYLRVKYPWYDKAAVDKLAEIREQLLK